MDFFRFGRVARDRRGSMMVEFSLVLPGFFILVLSGLTVGDAWSAANRVENVSNTLGVMISRVRVLANEDMVGLASAARGYMFPFPPEGLSILVASVWVENGAVQDIRWCERWAMDKSGSETCSGQTILGDDDMGYWVTGTNLTEADLRVPPKILNSYVESGKSSFGLVVVHVSYDWNAPYLPSSSTGTLTDFTMQDAFFTPPRADITLTPPERDRDTPKPNSSYKVRG